MSAEDLREWMLIFLKSRDVFQKAIQDIEVLNGDFVVKKATENVLFLVRPELEGVDEVASKEGAVGLVVLNRKRNVDAVVKGWDRLKEMPGLCIYFVNPVANEKWMLFPQTHDAITEKAALKKGLVSLFNTVPPC